MGVFLLVWLLFGELELVVYDDLFVFGVFLFLDLIDFKKNKLLCIDLMDKNIFEMGLINNFRLIRMVN